MASSNKQKSGSEAQQGAGSAASANSPTETQKGSGQKSSSERGTATHTKKNPGKRPHQGGGSR